MRKIIDRNLKLQDHEQKLCGLECSGNFGMTHCIFLKNSHRRLTLLNMKTLTTAVSQYS